LRGPTDRVRVGRYPLGIGGDLITAVDGVPATSNEILQGALSKKHGGDTLELTIVRNGKSLTLKVHLDEKPQVL